MNSVNHPSHYNLGASALAQPALAKLGILHYDSECIEAIEQAHPWLLSNSYAFTAVGYLWRCEYKGTIRQDLEKAIWFLNRGLDFWGSHCHWRETDARAAELYMMTECLNEVAVCLNALRASLDVQPIEGAPND